MEVEDRHPRFRESVQAIDQVVQRRPGYERLFGQPESAAGAVETGVTREAAHRANPDDSGSRLWLGYVMERCIVPADPERRTDGRRGDVEQRGDWRVAKPSGAGMNVPSAVKTP